MTGRDDLRTALGTIRSAPWVTVGAAVVGLGGGVLVVAVLVTLDFAVAVGIRVVLIPVLAVPVAVAYLGLRPADDAADVIESATRRSPAFLLAAGVNWLVAIATTVVAVVAVLFVLTTLWTLVQVGWYAAGGGPLFSVESLIGVGPIFGVAVVVACFAAVRAVLRPHAGMVLFDDVSPFVAPWRCLQFAADRPGTAARYVLVQLVLAAVPVLAVVLAFASTSLGPGVETTRGPIGVTARRELVWRTLSPGAALPWAVLAAVLGTVATTLAVAVDVAVYERSIRPSLPESDRTADAVSGSGSRVASLLTARRVAVVLAVLAVVQVAVVGVRVGDVRPRASPAATPVGDPPAGEVLSTARDHLRHESYVATTVVRIREYSSIPVDDNNASLVPVNESLLRRLGTPGRSVYGQRYRVDRDDRELRAALLSYDGSADLDGANGLELAADFYASDVAVYRGPLDAPEGPSSTRSVRKVLNGTQRATGGWEQYGGPVQWNGSLTGSIPAELEHLFEHPGRVRILNRTDEFLVLGVTDDAAVGRAALFGRVVDHPILGVADRNVSESPVHRVFEGSIRVYVDRDTGRVRRLQSRVEYVRLYRSYDLDTSGYVYGVEEYVTETTSVRIEGYGTTDVERPPSASPSTVVRLVDYLFY